MFKRLFVFLLATFSVQSPIFGEGCKKFLESQGYVRNKVKGVIVKDVWYAFDEEFMNDESFKKEKIRNHSAPLSWEFNRNGNWLRFYTNKKIFSNMYFSINFL